MQKSTFLLRPWQTTQYPQYSTYRPRVPFIHPLTTKNNQNIGRQPLKIQLTTQKNYDVLCGKSILSIKLIRNKAKTQQPQSKYLQTLKFKDFRQISRFKMKSQPKQQPNFMHKKNKRAISMQRIIPMISKQQNSAPGSSVLKLQTISSKHNHYLKNKKKSISSHSLNKQQKILPYKFKNDTSCLHLLNKGWPKQQLKLHNIVPLNKRHLLTEGIINNLTKSRQKSEEKDDSINKKNIQKKLIKMLQKSNRKKRQLQELIKSRMLIGKRQVENRIRSSRIQHIFISDLQDLSFNKGQFDDQNLYKPWLKKNIGTFFNNQQNIQ